MDIKKLLIIVLFSWILLFLFGCISSIPQTKTDCNTDWNCFYEKLTYCEPATVTTTEQKEIIFRRSYPWPVQSIGFYPKGTLIEILPKGDTITKLEAGYECKVKVSKVNISGVERGESICYYGTCQPNQEFKCQIEPLFAYAECNELR